MRKRSFLAIKSKTTFAIIVDGECEVWYFQMLKRNERSLTVNIKPEIPQKKSLQDQFKMVKDLSSDYTKVFWVLDLDVIIKESNEKQSGKNTPLNELRIMIKEIESTHPNVVIIANTPCLEFWFLLHYKQTTKYYSSCGLVVREVKNEINDYSKTKEFFTKQNNDIYLRLKSRLKEAINNAMSPGRFQIKSPNRGVSEMYLFFETAEIKRAISKEN